MDLHPAVAIAVPFLLGIISSYLSVKRGRSPYLWFFLGFLFGLLGIITLFFIKDNKPAEEASPEPQPLLPHLPQKLWYYLDDNNTQHGPISTTKLHEELLEGALSHSTYVWNEEMDDWRRIADLMEAR